MLSSVRVAEKTHTVSVWLRGCAQTFVVVIVGVVREVAVEWRWGALREVVATVGRKRQKGCLGAKKEQWRRVPRTLRYTAYPNSTSWLSLGNNTWCGDLGGEGR